MKICIAQTRPVKGDIQNNIDNHKKLIDIAVSNAADIIIFPELSLTGYEPEIAKELATDQEDSRFDDLQEISNRKNIIIGVGMPTKGHLGILISMIFFQPNKHRRTYSKQYLHKDELPYFVIGKHGILLNIGPNKISFAICYELSIPEHAANAHKNGTGIYIASVAKSANNVEQAIKNLSDIAKKYSITVLMSNCVGHCDNFESVGKSSVWNKNGSLLGQLDEINEGVLIVDTNTEEITKSAKIKYQL